MTINEIVGGVQPHKKCSRQAVHGYLRKLKIKPLGARQIPQIYPDDSLERILAYLGRSGANGKTIRHLRIERDRARRAA